MAVNYVEGPTAMGPKDPDSVLDYKMDWSAYLGADDTIQTSSWFVDIKNPSADDLEVVAHSYDASKNTTLVWVSGGILTVKYNVTNRITTFAGRTEDRTFTVTCRHL